MYIIIAFLNQGSLTTTPSQSDKRKLCKVCLQSLFQTYVQIWVQGVRSLYIVFFPKSFVIFLNSVSSAALLVFYPPGVCTHTDTEGKQRKASVRNILESSEKTQYLMNTL